MIRVLVFGMTENPGGVESFIMNYYRNIDRTQVQFDFLCNSYDDVAYEDELKAMGGKTIHFTSRRKNPAKFKQELTAFLAALDNRRFNVLHQRFLNAGAGAPECFVIQKQ